MLSGNSNLNMAKYTGFIAFLQKMELYGLTGHQERNKGKIVLVDDQYVTQQQISLNFEEISVVDQLIMFSNG